VGRAAALVWRVFDQEATSLSAVGRPWSSKVFDKEASGSTVRGTGLVPLGRMLSARSAVIWAWRKLRTDLPATHQTDICMTCRLWVIFVCLNGVAASPQNYTHPKVVAVRDVLVVVEVLLSWSR